MDNNEKLDKIIEVLRLALKVKTQTQDGLLNDIADASATTEGLMRRGDLGPAGFHEALRRSNSAYNAHAAQQQRGAAFEADCRRVGEALREKFHPTRDCRQPATRAQDSAADWATGVNAAGARMRR